MAIEVGDTLPRELALNEMRDGKPTTVTVGELVGGRKVVIFAVPGAFTPTCNVQLPGYVDKADALKGKGIDEIICLAVNDAFVMGAWGDASGTSGRVRMVADGNGDFTAALGLTLDGSSFGMGQRSQRYAMVVSDGTVEQLMIETEPGLDLSSADSVLGKL